MSDYTDLTSEFDYKDLLTWQNMDALAENDNYLRDFVSDYRRPVLEYVSATQVDIENNTGTSNETRIIFSDGTERSVIEDATAANKYRRFDITAAAEFTTGTEDSGIRSGITEATDTWYAIYVVKSTIDATKFVLAGDTTLPIQANFATLNTRYGTDGWIYIGMIRNGDNSATTGNILDFTQSGNMTSFQNTATGNTLNGAGIRFATSAAATSIAYTTVFGTGAAQIPTHTTIAIYTTMAGAVADAIDVKSSDSGKTFRRVVGDRGATSRVILAASDGCEVKEGSATGNVTMDIFLSGFIDKVLGISLNPLL